MADLANDSRCGRSIPSMVSPPVPEILGTELPEGSRFIGTPDGAVPNWRAGRAEPTREDLNMCVACGLCLPHCPTYRLTGEESQSPRGRIAAMRAVSDGIAEPERTFSVFMDACLVCRACEDVCPSHVPFGRMMEGAREQVEAVRTRRSRLTRWLGFHWILPHPSLVRASALMTRVARPVLPGRLRKLLPKKGHPFARLPKVSEPPAGVEVRGTVALLSGCAQDRWYHQVNRATIRVLNRAGWRITVPRAQACCGALAAHNGRLAVARRLATRAAFAFRGADVVVVNAAGCSAHMKGYEELRPGTGLPVRDLVEFLHDEGMGFDLGSIESTVAYHDACHALRQGITLQPRRLLLEIPELHLVDVPDGDRCCGAAGIHNVTQPEASGELGRAKAEAIVSTGATIVASANPGCSMQISRWLREAGSGIEVLHPVELLDRAAAAGGP